MRPSRAPSRLLRLGVLLALALSLIAASPSLAQTPGGSPDAEAAAVSVSAPLAVPCSRAYTAVLALFQQPARPEMRGWLIRRAPMSESGAGMIEAVQKDVVADRRGLSRYWYINAARVRLAPAAAGCALTLTALPAAALFPFPADLSPSHLLASPVFLPPRFWAPALREALIAQLGSSPLPGPDNPVTLLVPTDPATALEAATDALQARDFHVTPPPRTAQGGTLEAILADWVPPHCPPSERRCALPGATVPIGRVRVRIDTSAGLTRVLVTGLAVPDTDLGEEGEYLAVHARQYRPPARLATEVARAIREAVAGLR